MQKLHKSGCRKAGRPAAKIVNEEEIKAPSEFVHNIGHTCNKSPIQTHLDVLHSMISDITFHHLRPYEEAAGQLSELEEGQDSTIARIGQLSFILPQGMNEKLKHVLGQRIAILRTDLPDRPYLLRVLQSNRVETRQIMSPSTQTCEAFI